MKFPGQQLLQKLNRVLGPPGLEPLQQAARIHRVQRDIILPIKLLLVVTLLYYFYFSNWLDPGGQVRTSREVALDTIRRLFLIYVGVNIAVGVVFAYLKRIPLTLIQWIIFTVGLLDGLLFSALILITGGFDSILYWIFLGLILHNAVSIPLATPQIVLNLSVIFCYITAGVIDVAITRQEAGSPIQRPPSIHARARPGGTNATGVTNRVVLTNGTAPRLFFPRSDGDEENAAEPFLLRVIVLLLWTFCCYGLQALFEKERQAQEEAEEYAMRQQQLKTAGRMAAEIAHQIKNPLGIINNAVFSLGRLLPEQAAAREPLQIIREEIERADRIITEVMGYAQLSEGRVEKLNVVEELERALEQIFPPAANYQVEIVREYEPGLPALLMQRNHLVEIFANILQNAREAMNERGHLEVSARHGGNYSVVVTLADSGPGLAVERHGQIFEPYFTTKEKGSGLGLAIVKHNAEMYGGTVRLESELGKGARFVLTFPAKTLMKSLP